MSLTINISRKQIINLQTIIIMKQIYTIGCVSTVSILSNFYNEIWELWSLCIVSQCATTKLCWPLYLSYVCVKYCVLSSIRMVPDIVIYISGANLLANYGVAITYETFLTLGAIHYLNALCNEMWWRGEGGWQHFT